LGSKSALLLACRAHGWVRPRFGRTGHDSLGADASSAALHAQSLACLAHNARCDDAIALWPLADLARLAHRGVRCIVGRVSGCRRFAGSGGRGARLLPHLLRWGAVATARISASGARPSQSRLAGRQRSCRDNRVTKQSFETRSETAVLRLYNRSAIHNDARMPPRKRAASPPASKAHDESPVPEVILDFRFEQGLLYIALVNISAVPAYRVAVRFDKPFRGLGGECEISALRLFRRVEFLAPQKRIETLLDSSRAYFQRREPTSIKATVSFRGASGKPHTREIVHDLKIYRDLSYVLSPAASTSSSVPLARPCSTTPTPEKESPYGNLKREALRPIQLSR
jgi:hypothetical protein